MRPGRDVQVQAIAALLARLPAKPPRFDDLSAIGVSFEMLIDDGAEVQARPRNDYEIRHLGITATGTASGYIGCTVLWINLANAVARGKVAA